MRHMVQSSILCLLLTVSGWTEQRCAHATALSVAAVKKLQGDLLAVKVGEGGMLPAVPDQAQQLIGPFKDALVATTDAYLSCESSNPANAKAMERTLSAMVEANKPEAGEPSARLRLERRD